MFWIIAILILLVILWPYVLPLLAPVGTFLVVIASAPVVWTLKLIRRPKPQEEEDKLTKDASKGGFVILCLVVIGLEAWIAIKSIQNILSYVRPYIRSTYSYRAYCSYS